MSDMHFPTRAVCAACGGERCVYMKPEEWTAVLDRAYAEWQKAGFPAGEGVVHLWKFQRLGLWRPQSATAVEAEMRDAVRDLSQTSAPVDAPPSDTASGTSAPSPSSPAGVSAQETRPETQP